MASDPEIALPRLADEPRCTGAALRRATREMCQFYDRALRPVGLTLNQYSLLRNAALTPGASITELAARLAMDRTTLTRNLGPLEKSGWIEVCAGPTKRSRAICLTKRGRALLEEAIPVWRRAEEDIRQILGSDESRVLRDLLERSMRALRQGCR